MRNTRVAMIVECALAVAMAVVLNFVAIRLPINIAGGSISLTMLPIAIVALRRGPVAGMMAGAVFGAFDLLIEPFIVHWAQVFLDYPVPYLLFGLGVGLFARAYTRLFAHTTQAVAKGSAIILAGFILGGILRYASHVLSGVIFFSEYAGGGNVLVYSLLYNVTYLAPSLVATVVLALILVPILERAVPSSRQAAGKQQATSRLIEF